MSEFGRRAMLAGAASAAGGAATAATAGTAAAQDEEDVVDRRGESEVEIVVGPGGRLVYDPAQVRVDPGTTLRFVWESQNHNVVVDESPEGSDWEGTPNVPETYNTGYEFSQSLDVEGTYEYYCTPHRRAGMKGTVLVGDDAAVPADDEGGSDLLVLASFGTLLVALLVGIALGYSRLAGGEAGDADGDSSDS